MEPNDFKYLYCVQEYGIEEVVLESPERMATFMLVIMNSILQGFGAAEQ